MAEPGKFPSWKQALITFFGGIVLAGTSCFGFFVSMSGGNFERGGVDLLTPLAAICFLISLLVILVGFVLIIIRALRPSEKRPPLPPEPPVPGAPV